MAKDFTSYFIMMTSLSAIHCGDRFYANRKVGTGGVAEFTQRVLYTCWQMWLAVGRSWLALGGPIAGSLPLYKWA